VSGSAIERQQIRAQLTPLQYTTLASEIGAIVSKISVRESGAFSQGQLLIALDCSLQQAQLQIAAAEQRSAQSVVSANMRLDELNSVGKLELDLSLAALEKADAEVAYNSALLSKCEIYAPFSGRVADQVVREKQFVQSGQPLLEILDDSNLELEFIAPSHWLSWMKQGYEFEVTIDETGKLYTARFTRIGARVDPISQTVKVAAAIDGQHAELMAGMSGTVRLAVPTAN
jgi:RND family efflux transporter MFP subunit